MYICGRNLLPWFLSPSHKNSLFSSRITKCYSCRRLIVFVGVSSISVDGSDPGGVSHEARAPLLRHRVLKVARARCFSWFWHGVCTSQLGLVMCPPCILVGAVRQVRSLYELLLYTISRCRRRFINYLVYGSMPTGSIPCYAV